MLENNGLDDKIDLKEIIMLFWHGKYFIVIVSTITLILGSLHLRSLSPEFEVSLLLAPVQQEQSRPNFGNLDGLATLAGISLPSGKASDFGKFEIMLKTNEISKLVFESEKKLMQAIFSSDWDDKVKVFREPKKSQKRLLKEFVKHTLTGRKPPAYRPPGPENITDFISGNIDITVDKATQYVRLTTETADPKILAQLMLSMINNTDKSFKEKFIAQSNDAVKFYQIKIPRARSQEHREILATLIAQEERKLLLASRDGPFVAEILTGPNISLHPTSPKSSRILIVSIFIGIMLSTTLLYLRRYIRTDNNA